jgi:inner membrane protein
MRPAVSSDWLTTDDRRLVFMSPVTHFLTGWVLANSVALSRRDRALVTWSAVVPDIDGIGIVVEALTRNSSHPLLWFSRFHHSLHNLAFACFIAMLAFAFAEQKWKTSALCFLGFHLHLFEDLLGSRGPDGDQWPIAYLAPFSSAMNLTWRGQWFLNAWPNFAITFGLLGMTLYLAWLRGFSPVEMISGRADREFVATLRRRFPPVDRY